MFEKYIKEDDGYTVLSNVTMKFGYCGIDGAEFKPVCESNINNIQIPNTVNIIGVGAFENCTNLKEIIIPESVLYISYCAFYNCVNLEKVIINNPEAKISRMAFANCNRLTIYSMSDSTVSDYADKNRIKFEDISELI